MASAPNLVFFVADQMRADALGHLGNRTNCTPHLDRLVREEAISFRHAFCQNPVCTPSRCSFMTGWYPHVRGHRTIDHLLQDDEPCLLRTLHQAGWWVWWGGKKRFGHAGPPVSACGKCPPPGPGGPGKSARRPAVAQIPCGRLAGLFVLRRETGRGRAGPTLFRRGLGCRDRRRRCPARASRRTTLLSLPGAAISPSALRVEEPYFSAIDRTRLPPRIPAGDTATKSVLLEAVRERQSLTDWTEERWTELRAVYHGMCARVDHQFGLLMEALREENVADDTAVFFFSDHGDFTGDYGLVEKAQNTFEDCLVRVPLVVKPPRAAAARAGVREALVELLDLPATVHGLCGLPFTYSQQGKNLAHLWVADEPHREAVYCEGGRLPTEGHCSEGAAAGGTPGNIYWPRISVQRDHPTAHGKAIMCRTASHKYVRRLCERDELYDLLDDPAETVNRIDDPVMQPVVQFMRELLTDHLMETGDVVPWKPDARNGIPIA